MTNEEEREFLRNNSPDALPLDTSESGLTAEQIRKFFTTPLYFLLELVQAERFATGDAKIEIDNAISLLQTMIGDITTTGNTVVKKADADGAGNNIILTYVTKEQNKAKLDVAKAIIVAENEAALGSMNQYPLHQMFFTLNNKELWYKGDLVQHVHVLTLNEGLFVHTDTDEELQGNIHFEKVPTTKEGRTYNSGRQITDKEYVDTKDTAIQNDITTHKNRTDNPHSVTKVQVGLGNVTNDKQLKASERGAAGGVAALDINGKVPVTQLPDSIVGQLFYKGSFDASAGTTGLVKQKGDYYIASKNGSKNPDGSASTVGDYVVGDWAVYNGSGWDKIDNTDAVASVNGKMGVVVLVKGDIGLGNVDNTSDLDKPLSNAAIAAYALKLNSADAEQLYQKAIKDVDIVISPEDWSEDKEFVSGNIYTQLGIVTNEYTAIPVGVSETDKFAINEYRIDCTKVETPDEEVNETYATFTCRDIPTMQVTMRILLVRK